LICYLLDYHNIKKKWCKKNHYDIGLMFDFVKKNIIFYQKNLKIKALKLKVREECSFFFYIALFIQRLLGKNCVFIYFCWEKNHWKRRELLKNKREKKVIGCSYSKKKKTYCQCYYVLF